MSPSFTSPEVLHPPTDTTPTKTATTTTTIPSTDPIPAWVRPDLSRLLVVEKGAPGTYTSRAVSLVSLSAGAPFARLTHCTAAAGPAYTTVQAGPALHVELNDDLVYVNHACAPSLEFDLADWTVRVARDRPLACGDELTFFYPSTEWRMDRPFACRCGSDRCLGWIAGAAALTEGQREAYWLNGFIERMWVDQRGREAEGEVDGGVEERKR